MGEGVISQLLTFCTRAGAALVLALWAFSEPKWLWSMHLNYNSVNYFVGVPSGPSCGPWTVHQRIHSLNYLDLHALYQDMKSEFIPYVHYALCPFALDDKTKAIGIHSWDAFNEESTGRLNKIAQELTQIRILSRCPKSQTGSLTRKLSFLSPLPWVVHYYCTLNNYDFVHLLFGDIAHYIDLFSLFPTKQCPVTLGE